MEANVGQGVALLQEGLVRSPRQQDRVDLAGLIQVALQARERHVRGADVALLRAQRELVERGGGGGDGEADGLAYVVFSAM